MGNKRNWLIAVLLAVVFGSIVLHADPRVPPAIKNLE